MDQKLPVAIAALALLVVVGIWWQMQIGPEHEVLDIGAAVPERSADMRQPAVSRRSGGSTRQGMRAKRDAWQASRDRVEERADDSFVRERGAIDRAADARAEAPAPVAGGAEGREAAAATARSVRDPDEELEQLKNTALNDPDPDERISAMWSLSITDEAQALPVLSTALRDGDREVRMAALQELGGLEEESDVVDVLAIALNDTDGEIRAEAVRLIGDTEDPRALELARRLMSDPDPEVQEEARSVIESLEEE